jgi:LPXTG-motif cell wall-anchored protein
MVTYESNTKTFTVGNTPGVELPATGGPGTLVYTVTGLTLTLGAALWLILRRRKEQQN